MSGNFMFGEDFSNFIKAMIPGAHEASGGKEIVCRCRYCPDSTDPNHGHMYISVPQDQDDPILFHCFKCQTSGLVDSRTLMDWGIYDPTIGVAADKIIARASKTKKFLGYNRTWYPFVNYVANKQLAAKKLKYINQRLGTSITESECMKQKIILNLWDALDRNRIQEYTRHPNIVQQLDEHFVGFLSLDNNFVNMRRICDSGIVYSSIDKRYINYNIHGKKDNTEKMYVMPAVLDLTIPRKVNIHIAEGPFDILSIRYNLRKDESDYSIFAAVTGSGYKGLVMHFINTFKIFYFDLHVYPDNDKFGDNRMVEELNYLISPYGATLYEHRNTSPGEKDFGVPLNRINEKIYIHKPRAL